MKIEGMSLEKWEEYRVAVEKHLRFEMELREDVTTQAIMSGSDHGYTQWIIAPLTAEDLRVDFILLVDDADWLRLTLFGLDQDTGGTISRTVMVDYESR